MAADEKCIEDSCISDPNFAIICSFLERFAKSCGVTYPTFEDLQEMLQFKEQAPQELVDLHIKLLRKARKTVPVDRWERVFTRLLYLYSPEDSYELEKNGYNKLELSSRLRILKILMDAQFDWNAKLKNDINKLDIAELRLLPLGRDINGKIYWSQLDCISHIRVYQEDLQKDTWNIVARDNTSLIDLISRLTEEQDPEYKENITAPNSPAQNEASETAANGDISKNINNQITLDTSVQHDENTDVKTINNSKAAISLDSGDDRSVLNYYEDSDNTSDDINPTEDINVNEENSDCLKTKINLKFNEIKPIKLNMSSNRKNVVNEFSKQTAINATVNRDKNADVKTTNNSKSAISATLDLDDCSVSNYSEDNDNTSDDIDPAEEDRNCLKTKINLKFNKIKPILENTLLKSENAKFQPNKTKSSISSASVEKLHTSSLDKYKNFVSEFSKERNMKFGDILRSKLAAKLAINADDRDDDDCQKIRQNDDTSKKLISNDTEFISDENEKVLNCSTIKTEVEISSKDDQLFENSCSPRQKVLIDSKTGTVSNEKINLKKENDDSIQRTKVNDLNANSQKADNNKISLTENIPKKIPYKLNSDVGLNLTINKNAEKRQRSVSPNDYTQSSKKFKYPINNSDDDDNVYDDSDDEEDADYDSDDDVIEEPVMFIKGVGSGKDCNTGNPENEWNRDDRSNVSSTTVACSKNLNSKSATSPDNVNIVDDSRTIDVSQNQVKSDICNAPARLNIDHGQSDSSIQHDGTDKKKPKLWTIDAICGNNNKSEKEELNESNDVNEEIKECQSRSFSSSLISTAQIINPLTLKYAVDFDTGAYLPDTQPTDTMNSSVNITKEITSDLTTSNASDILPVAKNNETEEDYNAGSNYYTDLSPSANDIRFPKNESNNLEHLSGCLSRDKTFTSCSTETFQNNPVVFRCWEDNPKTRLSTSQSKIPENVFRNLIIEKKECEKTVSYNKSSTDCTTDDKVELNSDGSEAIENNDDVSAEKPIPRENNNKLIDNVDLLVINNSSGKNNAKVSKLGNKPSINSESKNLKHDETSLINVENTNVSERCTDVRIEEKNKEILIEKDDLNNVSTPITAGISDVEENEHIDTAKLEPDPINVVINDDSDDSNSNNVEISSAEDVDNGSLEPISRDELHTSKIKTESIKKLFINKNVELGEDSSNAKNNNEDTLSASAVINNISDERVVDVKSEIVSADNLKASNYSSDTADTYFPIIKSNENLSVTCTDIESRRRVTFNEPDETESGNRPKILVKNNDEIQPIAKDINTSETIIPNESLISEAIIKSNSDNDDSLQSIEPVENVKNVDDDVSIIDRVDELSKSNKPEVHKQFTSEEDDKQNTTSKDNSARNEIVPVSSENKIHRNTNSKNTFQESDNTARANDTTSEEKTFSVSEIDVNLHERTVSVMTVEKAELNNKADEIENNDIFKNVKDIEDNSSEELSSVVNNSAVMDRKNKYSKKPPEVICNYNRKVSNAIDLNEDVERNMEHMFRSNIGSSITENADGATEFDKTVEKISNENDRVHDEIFGISDDGEAIGTDDEKSVTVVDEYKSNSNNNNNNNNKSGEDNIRSNAKPIHSDSDLLKCLTSVNDFSNSCDIEKSTSSAVDVDKRRETRINDDQPDFIQTSLPIIDDKESVSVKRDENPIQNIVKREKNLLINSLKINRRKLSNKKTFDDNNRPEGNDFEMLNLKTVIDNTKPKVPVKSVKRTAVGEKEVKNEKPSAKRKYVKKTTTKIEKPKPKISKKFDKAVKDVNLKKSFKIKIKTDNNKKDGKKKSSKQKLIMSIVKDDDNKLIATKTKKTTVKCNSAEKSTAKTLKGKKNDVKIAKGKKINNKDDNNVVADTTAGKKSKKKNENPVLAEKMGLDEPSKMNTPKNKAKPRKNSNNVNSAITVENSMGKITKKVNEQHEEKQGDEINENKSPIKSAKKGVAKYKKINQKSVNTPKSKQANANNENKKPDDDDDSAASNGKETVSIEQPKISSPRISRLLIGLDIENVRIDDDSNVRSVRQSRRIAQIKIREQVENKYGDPMSPSGKESAKNKSMSSNKGDSASKKKNTVKQGKRKRNESDSEDYNEPVEKIETVRKRKKKKTFSLKAFNSTKNPWKSSSGSSSENEAEDEQFEYEEEEEEELQFGTKSDHEFSPESDADEDDEEYQPVRRARTARRETKSDEAEKVAAHDDELACRKCKKMTDPEWILLCDGCNSGWHTSCLNPPLTSIPQGDWFCPPCQHNKLISGLKQILKTYNSEKTRRENELLRKKRLEYVGISLSNILSPPEKTVSTGRERKGFKSNRKRESSASSSSSSSSSEENSSDLSSESEQEDEDEPIYRLRNRRQTNFSYRFNEFDDLINSAIQGEVEAKLTVSGVYNRSLSVSGDLKATTAKNNAPIEPTSEGTRDSATTNADIPVADADKNNDDDDNNEVKPKMESQAAKTISEDKDSESDSSNDDSVKSEVSEEYEKESKENERDITDEKIVTPSLKIPFGRSVRKKTKKLTQLDLSTDEDPYSDEDFKGSSGAEDDDDDYMIGETDSDEVSNIRRKRGKPQPTRRSTRVRTKRFDDDFINDDDSDDSELSNSKKKKKKAVKYYEESTDSEEEDSTWGKRKRNRYSSAFKKKASKKRKLSYEDESDDERSNRTPKKKRKPAVIAYGLSESDDETPIRRTRGRKMNYQEHLDSDSDTIVPIKKKISDDDDDYIEDEQDELNVNHDDSVSDDVSLNEGEDDVAEMSDVEEEYSVKDEEIKDAETSNASMSPSSDTSMKITDTAPSEKFVESSIKTYSKRTPEVTVTQTSAVIINSSNRISSVRGNNTSVSSGVKKVIGSAKNVENNSIKQISDKSSNLNNTKNAEATVTSRERVTKNVDGASVTYIPLNSISAMAAVSVAKDTTTSVSSSDATADDIAVKSTTSDSNSNDRISKDEIKIKVEKTNVQEGESEEKPIRPIRLVSPSKLMENPERTMINSSFMMSQQTTCPPAHSQLAFTSVVPPPRHPGLMQVVRLSHMNTIPIMSGNVNNMSGSVIAGNFQQIQPRPHQKPRPKNRKTIHERLQQQPDQQLQLQQLHQLQQSRQQPAMIPLHMLKSSPTQQSADVRHVTATSTVPFTASGNVPNQLMYNNNVVSTTNSAPSKRVKITPTRNKFGAQSATIQQQLTSQNNTSIDSSKISTVKKSTEVPQNLNIKTEIIDPQTDTESAEESTSSAITPNVTIKSERNSTSCNKPLPALSIIPMSSNNSENNNSGLQPAQSSKQHTMYAKSSTSLQSTFSPRRLATTPINRNASPSVCLQAQKSQHQPHLTLTVVQSEKASPNNKASVVKQELPSIRQEIVPAIKQESINIATRETTPIARENITTPVAKSGNSSLSIKKTISAGSANTKLSTTSSPEPSVTVVSITPRIKTETNLEPSEPVKLEPPIIPARRSQQPVQITKSNTTSNLIPGILNVTSQVQKLISAQPIEISTSPATVNVAGKCIIKTERPASPQSPQSPQATNTSSGANVITTTISPPSCIASKLSYSPNSAASADVKLNITSKSSIYPTSIGSLQKLTASVSSPVTSFSEEKFINVAGGSNTTVKCISSSSTSIKPQLLISPRLPISISPVSAARPHSSQLPKSSSSASSTNHNPSNGFTNTRSFYSTQQPSVSVVTYPKPYTSSISSNTSRFVPLTTSQQKIHPSSSDYHYRQTSASLLPHSGNETSKLTSRNVSSDEKRLPFSIPDDDDDDSEDHEESSGEFGGLVSYFSSQRENDLDS